MGLKELKRRNEIRNRLEKYDASRREKIALFQSSIGDIVLAPRADRVCRIEEEFFWGRVREQLRVWVDSCARESISMTSPVRDGSLAGEGALPGAVVTSPMNDSSPTRGVIDTVINFVRPDRSPMNDSSPTGGVIDTVIDFVRPDRTNKNTRQAYKTQINRFDRWLAENNSKKSEQMKVVNITTEGNLFVSQPIMDCILSYFYDLCSQVRTKSKQEFPFGKML